MCRVQAIVTGRVQGVGFRHFVYVHASRLGLTGWVRNLPNGDVELLAEGARASLDGLLEALHEGPRSSDVVGVTADWSEMPAVHEAFVVR